MIAQAFSPMISPADNDTKFCVIIPVYNEEENISILHKELISVLKQYEYELIYVNDGSTDSTYFEIKKALESLIPPYAKIINLSNNLGQSFAFKAGLDNARFSIIIFMDGDLQNDPRDIPGLLDKINDGYDLIQGIRYKRKDDFFKKIFPSVIANFILRILCGSKFKDIGCSLKAFKKSVALDMVFQQGMHRMLPIYFYLKGKKTGEIRVNHRKRIYGKTKYGFSRTFEVLFEIIKINFFEKNSNSLLFVTKFLFFLILFFGMLETITKLFFNPEIGMVYFILSIIGFYIFIISTVLYISKSFYIYYKNISKLENIEMEVYGQRNL